MVGKRKGTRGTGRKGVPRDYRPDAKFISRIKTGGSPRIAGYQTVLLQSFKTKFSGKSYRILKQLNVYQLGVFSNYLPEYQQRLMKKALGSKTPVEELQRLVSIVPVSGTKIERRVK